MMIRSLEEIIAWQKAQDLVIEIYEVFRSNRDFGFKDQLCRAAVSISNNIAEGFDRNTDAEVTRFLYFALGSCSEVRSMLYLAERLKYISSEKQSELMGQASEVSKITRGLIRSLSTQPR